MIERESAVCVGAFPPNWSELAILNELSFFLVCLVGLTKDLREDLLLLLVWVVTIGELSILQCTVNNTTTNTLIHKQQTKRSGGCSMMSLMTRSERRRRIGASRTRTDRRNIMYLAHGGEQPDALL